MSSMHTLCPVHQASEFCCNMKARAETM